MSFSGMIPLRYIQNHFIIFPSRRYLSTHASDLQFRYITLSSVHVYLKLLLLESHHFYHNWSFVSSLLLYFLWLHLIVVSETTGTRSCRVFQTTVFQLISSYYYTFSFFDDFVHELHKSVALLLPHFLSRKAVLGRMGISVLFRLGVQILDPVVMSAYEDRYDRTDEIRECDMSW